ncbi:MFS transporter [Extibacter muris]|nr:MFS transporter [Extibacter muris]MCB6201900.1 MFS transporter [Extibacter muris]MCQ4663237.1 MFS transporter [Extibacter muris]MCQ4692485.1 MFS transporter [Extibacter muris]
MRDSRNILAVPLYALMLVYAFSVTAIGPLLPALIAEYGIPVREAGYFSLFQGLGGIAGLILGVFFSSYLRFDYMIKMTAGIYGLSLLTMGTMPGFAIALLLFFLIGGSTKLLDSTLNAYVSELYREDSPRYLSILHACFGAGALTAPMIITGLSARRLYLSDAFFVLGGICMVVQIIYYLAQKRYGRPAALAPVKAGWVIGLLKDRHIVCLCLGVIGYTGFSCGCSMWLPSYMSGPMGVDGGAANYPVYAMWAGIIAGRLYCAACSGREDLYRYTILSSAAGGGVMLLATLAGRPWIYTASYAAAGFATGGVVPYVVAIANRHYPEHRASVTAVVMFAAAAGFMVFPALAGAVAEIKFSYGILLMNCFPFFIAAGMYLAKRWEPEKK